MAANPFAYLNASNDHHELHVRVMAVFLAAKRSFKVHLRPEDVAASLAGDAAGHVAPDTITTALDQLTKWGNLHPEHDTSRVTTVEDFTRARYLYQLTAEGEAAQRAVGFYEEQLGRRGALQSVALEDIRLRLYSLRAESAETDPDPAIVHNLLLELFGRLDSLAENAIAFMNGLQRTIDLQDIAEEAFLAYKDRLISYLERFIADLVAKTHDIGRTLRDIPADRTEALLRLAVAREAADVAPGDDPGAARAELYETWRARWSGLRSWFDTTARDNQANVLRQRARKAVPELLATVGLIQDRRAGHSDRTADFLHLARWFAQAPDEEYTHRLWRTAFGLSTSRHLTGVPTEAPSRTAWRDAPAAEIAPRLRATGHYQRRGRLSRVADRSAQREHLACMIAEENEQAKRARARLATGAPTKLSDLGELDRQEFRLFLDLLRTALSTGPAGVDGRIDAHTTDGTLRISLEPVPDGPIVELRTADGVLYGPEHVMTITDEAGGAW